MTVKSESAASVERFATWYGDGKDGSCPTRDQWHRLLARDPQAPITLINFFKLRHKAIYGDNAPEAAEDIPGQAAFARYAEVSMPTMERAGGRFLLVGPYEGMFLGEQEDWDLIAIGAYPDTAACLALYSDDAYRSAFRHRTAACERQKVLICTG